MLGERLADEPLYTVQVILLVQRRKGDGYAGSSGPAGPADTVDIVLGKLRQIKVNDMAYAGYVKTAGCNIGRYQEPDLSPPQIGNGAITRTLVHVAVQGCYPVTLAVELLGEGIGIPLGGGKYDGPA
jgi:hypothetical protein